MPNSTLPLPGSGHCHVPFWRAGLGSWDVTVWHTLGFYTCILGMGRDTSLGEGMGEPQACRSVATGLAFALSTEPALCSLAYRESPKVFLMLAGLQKFGKENRRGAV